MFTFNHFAELIKAGYTEDQIKDLYRIFGTDTPANPNPAAPATATTNPNTTLNTNPSTTPNPETPVSRAATANANPKGPDAEKKTDAAGQMDTDVSETKQMLAEMLGLMRKGYINQGGPDVKKDTAESVLATILSPSGISI